MPFLLAAAPGVVADTLLTASASVPDAMGASGGGNQLVVASAVLGSGCLVLLLAGLRAGLAARADSLLDISDPGRATRRMLLLSVAVGAAGLVAFAADPVRAAAVLQPVSIVLLAAAGLMAGGTLLLDLGRRTRVPVLLLVFAAAAVLAALRDRGVIPDNHALRQVSSALHTRPDVETAFLHFLDAAGSANAAPTPVMLVAASGGGIAAAYWTVTVLGDLADASPGFARQVFAMSGVSGGALGLLAYAAARHPACRDPAASASAAPPDGLRACLQLALRGEFLGPALGAMLYPDLLQRFLPFPVFPDRAEALERAWEARWRAVFGSGRLAEPFLDPWPDGRPWPALLLNGTSLNRGGRLVASNLSLGPDQVGGDGADLLALLGADMPASAAAGSSARFPYIGPLGTFHRPGGPDTVADGGYFENLGASTLLELLDVLDGTAAWARGAIRGAATGQRPTGRVRPAGQGAGNAMVAAAARIDRPSHGAAAHPGGARRQRVGSAGPSRHSVGRGVCSGPAGPLAHRANGPARLVAVCRRARSDTRAVDARLPQTRAGRRRPERAADLPRRWPRHGWTSWQCGPARPARRSARRATHGMASVP